MAILMVCCARVMIAVVEMSVYGEESWEACGGEMR